MELLLLIWLGFGLAAGMVLRNKGRSEMGGFLLGLLLGPLGLLIALLLGTDPAKAATDAGKADMRRCPVCAEDIRAEAIKCRFCGTDLPHGAPAR